MRGTVAIFLCFFDFCSEVTSALRSSTAPQICRRIFSLALQLKDHGFFRYNAGKCDVLNDIVAVGNENKALDKQELLLRAVVRQPAALWCGRGDENVHNSNNACCIAHIAKFLPMQSWEDALEELDNTLKSRLRARITNKDTCLLERRRTPRRSITNVGKCLQVARNCVAIPM